MSTAGCPPSGSAILQTVREFCDAEIRPHVMEWDEAQQFPREVFRKLGELGFLGVLFPEEYGGAGLSYVDYAGDRRGDLARSTARSRLSLAAHNSLGSNHIFQFGTRGAAAALHAAARVGRVARAPGA